MAASPLEGFWFGQQSEPGTSHFVQWLVHRRADGTFSVEFRIYEKCNQLRVQRESGLWRISERLYSTTTLKINGAPTDLDDPSFHDTYRIELLTPKEMRYTHLKTGREFVARRVKQDFSFPGCAPIANASQLRRLARAGSDIADWEAGRHGC